MQSLTLVHGQHATTASVEEQMSMTPKVKSTLVYNELTSSQRLFLIYNVTRKSKKDEGDLDLLMKI